MTNYRSGNFKQKNKPFKDSKKSKSQFKEENSKVSKKLTNVQKTEVPKISKKIKKNKHKNGFEIEKQASKKDCRKSKQKHNRINENKMKLSYLKSDDRSELLLQIVSESKLIRHVFGDF